MGSSIDHAIAEDIEVLSIADYVGTGGVQQWLDRLGILGQGPTEKGIPEAAFRLGERQIALLLRHLWASAGVVSDRSSAMFLPTESEGLARDVAALLLRLHVVARVRTSRQGRARPVFTLDVPGRRSQLRFLETVGGFGPLAGPVARLAASISASPVPATDDVFEPVAVSLSRPRALAPQLAAVRSRGIEAEPPADLASAPVEGQEPMFDEPATHRLSDLAWDHIVDISSAGREEVFDLTVPGPASWFADGIVSHNSGAIEQDADIVMFIHRDDLAEEAEKKNVAELIIAKHRNGPTGSIKLQFNPNLTQFRNYAPGP